MYIRIEMCACVCVCVRMHVHVCVLGGGSQSSEQSAGRLALVAMISLAVPFRRAPYIAGRSAQAHVSCLRSIQLG